ncbi:MAG: electron transfer flavoprotein subunit beta/FixA family protein [bacterium]
MEIIVCIKRVPQTSDAEVRIDSSGKSIVMERLTCDINEADAYALEQAVLFKEKFGGTVTAISLGTEDANESLRIALAKGADNAIRIRAEEFGYLDGSKTARILARAISKTKFDIVITGCMATDDAYSQVGPSIAELLGIPHATLVTRVEGGPDKLSVFRELEGGLLEHLEIKLPMLLAVQTGINIPRYASLIAIRRAAARQIDTIGKTEIGDADLTVDAEVESLFIPPVTKRAEILQGDPAETSEKLANIIKEKGLI